MAKSHINIFGHLVSFPWGQFAKDIAVQSVKKSDKQRE
jgi:hypothetical protein